ncbi:peptide chain release factor N(5)-glutamine methyltransferase [uncultured Nevskia sp.]|uniref:peptide chain release factor N(5)-glutamine methyltransferase n=1 Tax=uncultured Nevskia sp. TaxID=228950 RepID=UPI0025E04CB6|nr:peptide chain release factor N(5)-glutamine methyltransferase [uncultured Nevskia sp.]
MSVEETAAPAAQLPSDATPRPVPTVEGLAPGTVRDWLNWAESELEATSDSARADAEMLLARLIGSERSQLRLRHEDAIEAATVLRYASTIERRKLGEPVAYITTRQGFWTLELAVDTHVLIPRPDTETLVEWALSLLPEKTAAARVLDLGTGSGAIALAIASERPSTSVIATDVSEAALDVARENARLNEVSNVEFICSSWLEGLSKSACDERGGNSFDLIVSNPPYIAEGDSHLSALRYEPRLALTSGADGLDAIREIVRDAPAHLKAGGWLLLEHGYDQSSAVRALLQAAGFAELETRRDFGGQERVSGGRKAGYKSE